MWQREQANLGNGKDGFKNDVEQLEHELLKDMQRFKELIYTELAYIKEDCTTSDKSAKQEEVLIEEKLENCFADKFNTFSVTKIDVMAEEKLEKWISNKLGNLLTMQTDVWTEEKLDTWFSSKTGALLADNIIEGKKNKICILKAEVETLSKIREEIHRHAKLVAETTRTDFQRDQMDKQIQSVNTASSRTAAIAVKTEAMLLEVANAKALKEELEQVKRKASPIYRFNFETSDDKPVVQSDLEYFVQKSELAISDLAKSIKDVIDTRKHHHPPGTSGGAPVAAVQKEVVEKTLFWLEKCNDTNIVDYRHRHQLSDTPTPNL
eukprot:Gb_15859 [translate_table: standard]